LGNGDVEEAVDRKVATAGVDLGGAELHVVGVTAIAVAPLATKRGDFDRASPLRPQHRDHPKSDPRGNRPPRTKEPAYLVGRRTGRHIVVFWLLSQELISHAAPRPHGLVAGVAQLRYYLQCELAGK